MKYWIEDTDNTPQRFPLKKLLNCVRDKLVNRTVQFHILRSQGYGLTVNEWDSLLDEQESIVVDEALLGQMLEGVEQWFYRLDVEVVAENQIVRFGLYDSTVMYIEGPEEILNAVAERFSRVMRVDKTRQD